MDCIKNKVFLGDCLKILPTLPSQSVDMVLADLPYGTTSCHWDSQLPLETIWSEYHRICKDSGVIVLTASQPFTSELILSNKKNFKYTWVWDKVGAANFLNLKNRPFKTHEDVVIFSKTANFTFNPERIFRTEKSLKRDPINKTQTMKRTHQLEHYGNIIVNQGTLARDGKKHPIDIIRFPISEASSVNGFRYRHPTKKPLDLFRYLVRTYTNEGDLVLDNVAGSGTTAIACLAENRNYVLIEKEEKYYDLILGRINATLGNIEGQLPIATNKKMN